MWQDDISDDEFQRIMQAIEDRDFDQVPSSQQQQQTQQPTQQPLPEGQPEQKNVRTEREDMRESQVETPRRVDNISQGQNDSTETRSRPEYGAYGVVKDAPTRKETPSYGELSTSGKFQAQQSKLREELRRLKNTEPSAYEHDKSSFVGPHHETVSRRQREEDKKEQKRVEIFEKAVSLVIKDLKWRGASEAYVKNNMDSIEQAVKEFLGMDS